MNKYLPSKKFVRFIGIIVAIGIVIWIVSMLLSKKTSFVNKRDTQNTAVASDSIDDAYTKDSDGDGVYDWEETLWGTDPNKKDTNGDGMSDGAEIKAKKKDIQNSAEFATSSRGDTKSFNQTEQFAQQLLSTASLAKQEGGLTTEAMDAFSKSFGSSISSASIPDQFTLADIHMKNVTPAAYKEALSKAFSAYRAANISELGVLYRFANGDTSAAADIDTLIKLYSDLSTNLLAVQTPYAIAGTELTMANNAAKLSAVFVNMKNINDDPLVSVVGFKEYQDYSAELEKAVINLQNYFATSGV
jgi:hypothetical protein